MSVHREGMTAEDHREAAKRSFKAREESWERSDTDGFLSQWASGLTAQEHLAWADLLDNDGKVETLALFDLDGNVASTHHAWGQYGGYWVLNDRATAKYGKRFLSDSKASTAQKQYDALKKKGFTEGKVLVNGYVTITASGTGMSGAASARVTTQPIIDDLKNGNYTIKTTDAGVEWFAYLMGER